METRNKTYQVLLTDGKKFTFDYFGEWLSIDCGEEPIPLLLVPRKVRSKVARSYGFDARAVKMVKKNSSFKSIIVTLNNGVELTVEF